MAARADDPDDRVLPVANQVGKLSAYKYQLHCAWLDLTLHPVPIWSLALLYLVAGTIARPFSPAAALFMLSQGHLIIQRTWGSGPLVGWLSDRITRALASVCRQSPQGAPSAGAVRDNDWEAARNAGIVLKAPRLRDRDVIEKGVLLLKYTHRIAAFHRCMDMEALLRHYRLVLEPSWSGYASFDFLAFTRYRKHPIVVFSPFRGDYELLETLGSNLTPIELGSGDWVDPRLFRPLEHEQKRYDAVMIARWSHIKRHDLLLKAIREIADPTFRVALVAMRLEQDSDRQGVLAAIEASGLQRQVEVFEDIDPEEVNLVLNRSKVNVLLSRQEGANRGLFEGFFAGVPGLALRNHVGLRIEHFRPETGRLIERGDLTRELLYFREHWSEFDPRPWALRHIAPEVSSRRLNESLKRQAERDGESWTEDIVMKCNRPDLQYYPDERRGEKAREMDELLRRFGVRSPSS